jgi:hypothetical protein
MKHGRNTDKKVPNSKNQAPGKGANFEQEITEGTERF